MVLSPDGAVLLLIDLQERLMPVIGDHEAVVARAVRLAEAATLLDVPVRATEQNPAGLGPTVPDLLAAGRRVVWAGDATGSRDPADRAAAIDRARQHGAEIVTSEMVLFEWLRDSRHPEFREVQKLLR